MADGALTITLDDETARRLKAAADAVGRPVDDYAATLIAEGLDDGWAEALEALAEYDRTGEAVPLEQALAEFRAAVEARIAAQE